jgi:putative Holliday junction resolvase
MALTQEETLAFMRIMGLDVGQRRIGIALSDPLGISAQPLMVLERTDTARDMSALQALIVKHMVETVVVGLPLTMRGENGPEAQRIRTFVQTLKRSVAIPIQYVDERLTTVQAERALLETDTSRRKRKRVIDKVAAQLILQHYLDSRPTSRR